MEKQVALDNGNTLHVHDVPGEDGTIIAVHGLTGNHKQLAYYEQALAGEYRFISYDLRGRGNSSPASVDMSIDTHVEDLLELIRSLDIDKPMLMGYSMGAYICAKAASMLEDVAGLILLDGAGEADEEMSQLVLPSLSRLKKTYISPDDYRRQTKQIYEKLGIDWKSHLEDVANYEIEQKEAGWVHKSDASVMEQDFNSFYQFNHELLRTIDCLVLLIVAKGNVGNSRPLFKESSYDRLKKEMKNLDCLDTEANHYTLVFNRQEKLNREIRTFLQAIRNGRELHGTAQTDINTRCGGASENWRHHHGWGIRTYWQSIDADRCPDGKGYL